MGPKTSLAVGSNAVRDAYAIMAAPPAMADRVILAVALAALTALVLSRVAGAPIILSVPTDAVLILVLSVSSLILIARVCRDLRARDRVHRVVSGMADEVVRLRELVAETDVPSAEDAGDVPAPHPLPRPSGAIPKSE